MFVLVEFTDDLLLGDDVLDLQHRELISIYNEFLTFLNEHGMETVRTQSELHVILDKLIKYAGKHFAYEEQCMQQAGYLNLQHHQFEHNAIAEKLADYCVEIFSRTNMIYDFVVFFESWIITHIKKSDFDFIISTKKNK